MSKRVKVAFAGQSGVGKSSIVYRFFNDHMRKESLTIGVSFMSKKISHNNEEISIDIWDTAGQERYQAMSSFYFRGARYCFLVFDLSDIDSIYSIVKWKKICDNAMTDLSPDPIYLLIGNKSDIQSREVSRSIIDMCCKNNNITHYFEVSAYNGNGIPTVLDYLINHIIDNDTALSPHTTEHGIIYNDDSPNPSYCSCQLY